ncbi:hypothetical protein HCG51_28650 [Tolypothrix sp. PCC 7910]|uniref:restriction endonuclease subunit S n=1 Tax=Tolypothrix sp. PCC 7910 TaxID=2099387 RepID=UPI0014278C89|nr:restriction endonuclease subunit S [Tolypothrix sp. PCC 7910]QIR40292.1 hypothetical protein HCG51_28650 [Tolypothrix sp. PCC 7910]
MREVLVKNEEFKDSPVGKIPQDWEVKTLGDCAFITKLAGFEYTNYFDYSQQGEVIALRVLNIRNGVLDLSDIQSIPRKVSKQLSRSSLGKGDLVISYVGTIGEVALIEEDERFHLAPNVAKISPNPEIVRSRFLLAQILSQAAQKRILDLSTLTSQPALSMSRLRQLMIVLPPIPEQRRIAEILDTVDEAIARTSSLIIKLKQTKTGLLQDLLTRGLDEHGKLRDPQAHPEQFKDSPLGRIPKEWDVSDVEIQFDITAGFTLGEHRRPRNNKRKYLRVANVHRDEIVLDDIAELEAEDHELSSRLLQKDDLLIVEGHANPDEIGRCAIVPAEAVGLTFQNHLFRLRCKSMNPNFALAWLNSEWVRAYWRRLCGTSSGLNTINRTMLNAIFVPISTQDEQRSIVAIIDTYKRRIRTEEAYLNKLKLQKQGLMQDLLTGKVRVKSIK